MKSKSNNPKKNRVKHSGIAPGMTVNFSGVPQTDDATNGEYKTECANIEALILREYVGHTVSISDFIALSRSMDIPFPSLQNYFAGFVKRNLADKRIEKIQTIMDSEHYRVV
jgi:hypothetical protein